MREASVQDQKLESIDYTISGFPKGEYDNCIFTNCNFSGCNVTETLFIDCQFINCNFSSTEIGGTAFRDVTFKDCVMHSLRFDQCNDFGLSFTFDNCQLDHATFYTKKIKKTKFTKCRFQRSDFTNCDLTESIFNNCDLDGAIFDNTILEKVDLRSSYDYVIEPMNNKLKKAKFSLAGIPGLLQRHGIIIEK